MTPLGHGAVGWVTGHAARSVHPWAFVVGAVAPDLDFLLWWAPQFNAWHRVVTHNVWFVALVALVALVAARNRDARGVALGVLAGGITHLLVDACMDTNPSNGLGIAAWWPISDAMFCPFNLLEPSNARGSTDLSAAAAGVARGLVFELPFVALAVALWVRRRRTTR